MITEHLDWISKEHDLVISDGFLVLVVRYVPSFEA